VGPVTATQADRIEARLRAAGTAERAEGEKRYLKSELEHLGVGVPAVRREARAAGREVETREELLALVRELWAKPVHERRLCAALLLEARGELLEPGDLAELQRLVRESRTWALVDPLAVKVTGRLLVAHPEAAPAVDEWAADEDFWVRRAALLSQIEPLRAGATFERFGRYADAMLEEREFFIRKAIGWALREAGKTRPDEVYEWLVPRAARASGVTMREAVKPLSERQREALRGG
jgi:3-methyladenine DNA glycosylase AlkD